MFIIFKVPDMDMRELKIAGVAVTRDKTDQLNTLNQQYEKLQMQEAEQKDDNQQQMNKMEINHSQCKEELQELYEKKLEYE